MDLIVKLQASAATVDATLLHGSKLWAHIAAGPALRIEAMHTRWLRKATGEYRAVSEDWQSEAEVRVTYNVASTCSLIAFLSPRLFVIAWQGQPVSARSASA